MATPFLSNTVMANPTDSMQLGIGDNAALQHNSLRHWHGLTLAAFRIPDIIEQFLDHAQEDRAPWMAVAFACGVAAWFILANRWEWLALIFGGCGFAAATMVVMEASRPFTRRACVTVGLMLALGCACVWGKSWVAGTPPITHAIAPELVGRVLERVDDPAFDDVRLLLAVREPRTARVVRIRVSVPANFDRSGLTEGAMVQLRARLMPPAPPLVPGARNIAEEDWFSGISGSGRSVGSVKLLQPAQGISYFASLARRLGNRARGAISGSGGGIAATLVSGNRGGIDWADQQAMRDAGLTHLLAISGLHVSAVVTMAWIISYRLLALWPWLALRVRLPLVSSGFGAFAGVFYTLLTGAHLPTVRACAGALLVLAGLALGRQVLSMRLLATAAMLVMLAWPESVIGPSFQMSFGSVMAIVALHESAPVHDFLVRRSERRWHRLVRHGAALLLSGMVIDLALMPVALYHFHRAGAYGAIANLIAIPLVTFVAMPLIALALFFDLFGLGTVFWQAAGFSLNALLRATHMLVSQPGAVAHLPTMEPPTYVLFVAGMVWLALWHGRVRLMGLVPIALGVVSLGLVRAPDVLITGDARNLAIMSDNGTQLHVLREGRSPYQRERLLESVGQAATVLSLASWPGASCNRDFCLVTLSRGGRLWRIMMARNDKMIAYASMARACSAVDIVITQIKLYGPCHPSLLVADRNLLMRTGGLALDLVRRRVTSVEETQGQHPWWRAPYRLPTHASNDWVLAPENASETASSQSVTSAHSKVR